MSPAPLTTFCTTPGCLRSVQFRNTECSQHDGRNEPLICICPIAYADGIGQCVKCWRPIVSLHPVLDDGGWPGIDNQIVVPAPKKVAS